MRLPVSEIVSELGDVAPARALWEQPLDEAGPEVIAAARAFVAGG